MFLTMLILSNPFLLDYFSGLSFYEYFTEHVMFGCSDASFGYPGGPILFKNLNFGIDLDSRIASKNQ